MTLYTSASGDTWDFIAYKFYGLTGKEFMMSLLLEANSEFLHFVILPPNLSIVIPDAVIPDTTNLPPWLL